MKPSERIMDAFTEYRQFELVSGSTDRHEREEEEGLALTSELRRYRKALRMACRQG